MTTGERIKELRRKRGMTQTQLADKCKATKQAVSMWETNNATPSRISLEMLCDLFNVEMDYILCRQDVTLRYLNSVELDLIDAFRACSPEMQDGICRMLGVKRAEDMESVG